MSQITYTELPPAGRLRLRVPHVKNSPQKAQEFLDLLITCPGVIHATVHPVSGTACVLVDPAQTPLASIREYLSAHGYVARRATHAAPPTA